MTSSWSGPSDGDTCAPHVRHFIVHMRRASRRRAPPLNCGVREQVMGNRKLAIGAALLCCIGSSVRADSVSSYFGGLRYDFSFTCLDLGKAPLWLERDAAPPLAPRNAISIAREQLDGLVPNSVAGG